MGILPEPQMSSFQGTSSADMPLSFLACPLALPCLDVASCTRAEWLLHFFELIVDLLLPLPSFRDATPKKVFT